MQLWVRLVIVCLVLLALPACGAQEAGPEEPAPASSGTSQSRPTPTQPLFASPVASEEPAPAQPAPAPAGDSALPPAEPVRLVFIHHSTGGDWLADPVESSLGGDLGRLLMENNYYVSATNYGWGPDSIGDATDLGQWWDWFRGPNSPTYLAALFAESGQNFGDFGPWPRLEAEPGGENQVILFKSCFPNSFLGGSPADPPVTGENPMRGASAGDDGVYTVGNAKGLYNDLLETFAAHPDKLFIAITAPPLAEAETDAAHAANARAFNNWLANDWLAGYPYPNVAVFDYFNVLTSSGGSPDTNDLGAETGNHHRWLDGAIQHIQGVQSDFSAYPSGDSHPTGAGHQKAAAEFVPLLNVYYHRWAGDAAASAPEAPGQVASSATGAPAAASTGLIQPGDFAYLGAFRLPEGRDRPLTFAYGGSAMTFNPDGDPSGPPDGFPGSLFVAGHDRLPYGELPNGSQIAEIRIPAPVLSSSLEDLNRAEFLQDFREIAAGFFTGLDELPRMGLLYLNHPATGPKIHLAWGQHLQPEPPVASHAWFSPNLASPDLQGTWFIDDHSPYSVNGYLLEIPADWAASYAEGRVIGTGRYKDGGWSGMGPNLFAYLPWVDEQGTPAADGARLPATPLLHYQSSQDSEEIVNALAGYQHPDEWEGAAWLTTLSGKSALVFAGTKSVGAKYWYGFVNPAGPDRPCVAQDFVGQFTVCRLGDGQPCPAEDLTECPGHNDYRGWWTTQFTAQLIFYDPAGLAQVALGQKQPWEPQPYAVLPLDERLFLNPAGVEPDMLGTGPQRRYRLGEMAYDRENNLLYLLELFADEASPVVHVWKVAG